MFTYVCFSHLSLSALVVLVAYILSLFLSLICSLSIGPSFFPSFSFSLSLSLSLFPTSLFFLPPSLSVSFCLSRSLSQAERAHWPERRLASSRCSPPPARLLPRRLLLALAPVAHREACKSNQRSSGVGRRRRETHVGPV